MPRMFVGAVLARVGSSGAAEVSTSVPPSPAPALHPASPSNPPPRPLSKAASALVMGLQVPPSACARPSLPDSIDVAQLDATEVARLIASRAPRERALGFTAKNARLAYGDYIAAGARIVVTTSSGNDGYPVLAIVGPKFDCTQPPVVHTHYHGWASTVTDSLATSSRAQARVQEVQRSAPQTVFVLPECSNAPTAFDDQTRYYKTDWSNVRSQPKTTAAALAALGLGQPSLRVVSAHSAGGQALANAIRADASGAGLAADRLELLDCFYGSERLIAAWASTTQGAAVRDVTYVHGTNDYHADSDVARAFGTRYRRLEVADAWTGRELRKGLARTTNLPLVGPDGKPAMSKGVALERIGLLKEPHSRARGDFMHVTVANP